MFNIEDILKNDNSNRTNDVTCTSNEVTSMEYTQTLIASLLLQNQALQNNLLLTNQESTALLARRKGGQIRFSSEQTRKLEGLFINHKYLTPQQRKVISDELGLSERQVKTWFQNRRAKWRRLHGGI